MSSRSLPLSLSLRASRSRSNLRLYLSAIAVAWGACLFGYDSSYIGVTITLPSFTRDFGLDGLAQAQSDVRPSLLNPFLLRLPCLRTDLTD